VSGRGNIPLHTNSLIVSNHASHLDVGLVKLALGEYGRHAVSLGARDYFFSTSLRRFYFENFTEVLPFDRRDTSREKLDQVVGRIATGESVIIFPEGTRAQDGRLGAFRSGLGYLVLKARIGVLPIWLEGTHRALPKGASVLRSRELGARIGRFIPHEELAAVARGLNRHEAYKAIGAYVRAAVERLRDGAADLPAEARREIATPPEAPESRARRLLCSLPARHKPGRITQAKHFYVKFGEGQDDRYTIALSPERCLVTPGKGSLPADCVVRSTPEVLEKLIEEGSGPTFEDIAGGSFKTNDPDALTLLVEALGLGERAVR
jgi:long-chain acyl-CoA synthetase